MRTIVLLSALILSSCSHNSDDSSSAQNIQQKIAQNKQEIRAIVENVWPQVLLTQEGSIERISSLMDFVYTNTKWQHSDPSFKTNTVVENLRLILSGADYGHLCGGVSATLYDVLTAYDFEARRIGLFSADPAYNHVVAEVFVNGQWVALDPSFDAYFVNDNSEYISVFEINDILNSGHSFHRIFVKPITGPNGDFYYTTPSTLFHRIEIQDMNSRWLR